MRRKEGEKKEGGRGAVYSVAPPPGDCPQHSTQDLNLESIESNGGRQKGLQSDEKHSRSGELTLLLSRKIIFSHFDHLRHL